MVSKILQNPLPTLVEGGKFFLKGPVLSGVAIGLTYALSNSKRVEQVARSLHPISKELSRKEAREAQTNFAERFQLALNYLLPIGTTLLIHKLATSRFPSLKFTDNFPLSTQAFIAGSAVYLNYDRIPLSSPSARTGITHGILIALFIAAAKTTAMIEKRFPSLAVPVMGSIVTGMTYKLLGREEFFSGDSVNLEKNLRNYLFIPLISMIALSLIASKASCKLSSLQKVAYLATSALSFHLSSDKIGRYQDFAEFINNNKPEGLQHEIARLFYHNDQGLTPAITQLMALLVLSGGQKLLTTTRAV
ncbi:hypothetical protein [Candidatus Neptunochlamydia vexilliferae]|uniref:Uncharacterized protein n=1 Tax=Candidatus Neptunichlamydia vexilliferae TaxID=1651774 RepID=A0ABS0B3U2_9BACT|nr:hypothetical protein [Candidatus Neptunochlamydia vexilliferae]MBF5060265.1 hypothetical protein [Candidatus Neptunochlamydia vexilliferae]